MKKLTSIFSILLLFGMFISINAQTAHVETFGVSPRDAHADTNDILDRAFNGLQNVGVETQMYLDGYVTDGTLSGSQSWQVVTSPDGSTADFSEPTGIEDTRERVIFTPDSVGQYLITFADGGSTDSIWISAGLYKGIDDGGCGGCHSDYESNWAETGHSDMLERGLNGEVSSHYASYCIDCHTVGYDENADNDGFDDREFVFPDSLYLGQYDNMVDEYPDAMKLANIQCESCHGPGSEHFGDTEGNKMQATLSSDNCAWCHDDGTHHVYPEQWDVSQHANLQHAGYAGGIADCAICHTGSGFVAFMKNDMQPLEEAPPRSAITCASCHNPHESITTSDGSNTHQLRNFGDANLNNGDVVAEGGLGKFCMNCHKSRRDAALYTGEEFHYSSHYGPHHGPQADMLAGKNVPTFGIELPSTTHLEAIDNSCVTCHMAPGHVDENDNVILVGSHTFNVTDPDGNDNVEICADCHGDIGSSFANKAFEFKGVIDHDGDGEEEGLQHEVEGMLHEIALNLPPYDTAEVNVDGTYEYNSIEKKASYNYFFVEEDRSLGIHNPAFTVSLLNVTKKALNFGVLEAGVIESVTDVPNDQGYKVNVVWTRFGGDGVSDNPILNYAIWRKMDDSLLNKNTNIYKNLNTVPNDKESLEGSVYQTQDNHLWTFVELVPAAGQMFYSAIAPTVYNTVEGDTAWTEFKVTGLTNNPAFNATSDPKAGFSVDNLDPMTPGNIIAEPTENSIDLSWEDPVDEDFQYFTVYRSTEQGFDPSQTAPLDEVTNPEFTDMSAEAGQTYYYKISATDFNANESDYSDEVNATITDVKVENGIPEEYALKQNYPNPFNPSTVIKYQLPEASNVKITVFDITGKEVATLVDESMNAGYHYTVWNANNISTGIYFYRMQTDNFVKVHKMILMK